MKPLLLLAVSVLAGFSSAQNFKGHKADFSPLTQTRFKDIQGVQEFTGRLIVRPFQIDAWKRMGVAAKGAQVNRTSARQRIGDITVGYIAPIDCYIVRVPQGSHEQLLAKDLMTTGLYEYVSPDYRVFPTHTPNDILFGSQWSHMNNDSTEAWDICRGNADLIVAVTDTGVHVTHEDLAATRVPGANSATATTLGDVKTEAVHGVSWIKDLNGHGTHCTGIADAIADNNKGVAGVNIEGTRHLMVRVSDFSGGGSTFSALSLGALWAASNGCRVVSTSYSAVQQPIVGTTGTTIKNTYNGVYCYAAGNDGGTYGATVDWPDVTIVGSIDSTNTIANTSARGQFIDVMAPGVSILSTVWNNDANIASYGNLSGTSMATPFVAGLATLILAQNPNYTAQRVEDIIYRSCQSLGTPGTYGWGRVNLWNAMGRKANSMTIAPGFLVSGVLADLYRIEGDQVVVRPGIVPNVATPPIQVETVHNVPAYANNNFGEIDIMTKTNLVGATGAVSQRVMIYNNATASYETVATGPVNGNFFEAVKTVDNTNFANYIVGGTVKVKVQVFLAGSVSNSNWSVGFDQINVRTLRSTE